MSCAVTYGENVCQVRPAPLVYLNPVGTDCTRIVERLNRWDNANPDDYHLTTKYLASYQVDANDTSFRRLDMINYDV